MRRKIFVFSLHSLGASLVQHHCGCAGSDCSNVMGHMVEHRPWQQETAQAADMITIAEVTPAALELGADGDAGGFWVEGLPQEQMFYYDGAG